MAANESSFSFRTRVQNYQLERTAVGLAVLPDEEIIIGILNRLEMSRYSALVANYLDNERRGIRALPDTLPKLWKELKDAQIIRFRGAVHPSSLESVFVSAVDQPRSTPARRNPTQEEEEDAVTRLILHALLPHLATSHCYLSPTSLAGPAEKRVTGPMLALR